MFKKILIACTLLSSSLVHAGLIEFNGYSRYESSSIVTGGGLEWLKWDQTSGMSVEAALAAYAADGWRLTERNEMLALLDAFQFWSFEFDPSPGDNRSEWMPWTADEDSPHNHFIQLFGYTWMSSCTLDGRTSDCYHDDDPYMMASAIFGADYHMTSVADDYTHISWTGDVRYFDHQVSWWGGPFTEYFGTGVALSRGVQSVSPSPVPNPDSFSLLMIALAALVYQRRRQGRR